MFRREQEAAGLGGRKHRSVWSPRLGRLGNGYEDESADAAFDTKGDGYQGDGRAHRTVSTLVLLVLARTLPWDSLASERAARYTDEGLDLTHARAATIRKVQEEWDQVGPQETPRGVWTKSLIPDVGKWMDRPGGELSYEATQVLTGHGQFQTYMVRIGKAQADTCVLCNAGVTDDVEHTVLRCSALQEARDKCPTQLRDLSVREIVNNMIGSGTVWEEGLGYFNRVMRLKKRLEETRRKALVSNGALPARQDGTQGGGRVRGSNGSTSHVNFSSLGASSSQGERD